MERSPPVNAKSADISSTRQSRQSQNATKEPWTEQAASFVGFFIYLLILKSFFLPLFIIPTGSMAETLYGAHALHTCPNCGVEYALNWDQAKGAPAQVSCPNCRWVESRRIPRPRGAPAPASKQILTKPLRQAAGDRIFVQGWPYAWPLREIDWLGPQRWDVVVFKVPNDGQTNYIKRLIGLPGETIEIIDGNIFADGEIAQKTPQAQQSLWFPYYNHDYPPRESSPAPSKDGKPYWPRWIARHDQVGWTDVDSRVPRFDGAELPRAEIQFVTRPGQRPAAGEINAVYGYNSGTKVAEEELKVAVRDVRLSAEVEIEDGDGYVELSTTNHEDRFYARLYADGLLTLEHDRTPGRSAGEREVWDKRVIPQNGPVKLALSSVDYAVSVAVNGETVLRSTPEQWSITPEGARLRIDHEDHPELRCAAERIQVRLRHLLIERDVYYFDDRGSDRKPANAAKGRPLQLGPTEYFCCGDNSPNSSDGRYWREEMLGPHLQAAHQAGKYTVGTVPADQMIGRAFFVYWPGFKPLLPGVSKRVPNLLPDLGRARWIR